MSAFPLDPIYNDFVFVGGNITLLATGSLQECAQELNARFGFGKGEWFLDIQQGFPWMQAVLVKGPDLRAIAQMFSSMILTTPGVKKVLALPLSFAASIRKLTVGLIQIQHDSGAIITGGAGQPFIVQNNQQIGVQ